MYKSSKISGSSGSGSIRYYEKTNGRYNIGTRLIDEDEFKQDHNQIYSDDSKFARQLKKLLRDEDEEEKLKKLRDLSSYLDHHENIKFVLKLGKQSLNILIKLLFDQLLDDNKKLIVECISKIGSIMMMTDRDPNRYFEWILELVSIEIDENSKESLKDNNIKSLVMDALYQSFESDIISRYIRDNINFILVELKKLLESVDNSILVMKTSQIILLLAKSYPFAINQIFHDVVDILIAWHIDYNQSDEVIEFTSNSLVELRSNWLADLNFTFNLLEQFVEDVESYLSAYFQDTSKRQELENIEKIAALFKVYHTVVRSISCIDDSYHKPLKTHISQSETEVLCSTFHRLLNCALKVYDSNHNELLFTPINQITALLCDIFDDRLEIIINQSLIDYIIKLNFNKESWFDYLDLSFINLIQKVIKHFIASNSIDLISQILSYDGRIWSYKFSSNTQIVQECLKIYKNLILVKVIPAIQEVYKNILHDTDLSFTTILKYSNSNNILSLIKQDELDSADCGLKILNSVKNAESCLLFNLAVFAELGNVKNNLILMYALSPSLFQLLTERLSPLNWSLAETFPNIQYAIISRLYNLCLRHENFIVTSSLFVHKYGNDSPTKDYFRIIVEYVTKLLVHPTTSIEICTLLLKWSMKFIETITVENGTIFSTNLFINFINALITISYSNEDEIASLSNEIFLNFLAKFDKINETCLNRIFDLCKYFLMSPNKTIRSNYMKLMTMIPLKISLSQRIDLKSLGMQDFSNFSSLARHNYILSSSDCVISSENFKTIMSFVLAGIQSDNDEFEKSCIERIYYSCRRNTSEIKDQGRDSVAIDSIIENHDGILWFWALWECAQFCVQSRLKTPLGKAQDTFVAIESVLKNYSNYERQNQSMDKSKNVFIDLNRINLLEHFVDLLERIIYNAYEGIASGQQSVQKIVKVFFRTNKSTCNEWFSRVRFFLSSLCVKSGNYELGIRQCWEYLNYCTLHNNTSTNEFDIIVQMLVKCYIKLGCWQQLIGLGDWLKKSLKKNGFEWTKIAADEARGCLENASIGYKESIGKILEEIKNEKDIASDGLKNLVKFQAEKLFDCFLQLNDWNEYISWYNDYKANFIQDLDNDNYAQQLEKCIDIDHIKAMSSFNEGDFESVSCSIGQDTFENFIDSIECKWNFEDTEKAVLKNLQKTIMVQRISIDNEPNYLNELSDQILKILNIDEMSYSNHQKLILILLINNVLDQKAKCGISLTNSDCFNLSKHSVKYLNTLLMMSKNYEFNFDLNLACAKLARKQNNNNLSTRLLDQQAEYFRTSLNLYPEESSSNFYDSVSKLMSDIQNLSDHQLKLSMVEFLSESSKLLAKKNFSYESIDILSKSVVNYVNFSPIESLAPASFTPGVPFIATNINTKLNESLNQKCSKLLMALSKFLSQNPTILKSLNQSFYCLEPQGLTEQISSNLSKILSFKYSDLSRFNLKNEAFLNNESMIGNILDLASVLAPSCAKTWFTLGNWCYKWGKKYADKVQMGVKLSQSEMVKDSDVSQLMDLLPVHCPDDEKQIVLDLYSKCLSLNHSGDENLQNPMFQFNSEIFRCQAEVQLVENCKTLGKEHIESIVNFLMNIIDRVIYYLKIACKSYFMFLRLNDTSSKSSDEKNISSSLRIIKLLVKYAIELKDDLKMGLDETPSEPWKNIIPQLFSRLNHPEMYVRESVSQLLCRIAKDFPHLIIYPAVVGSQDGPTRIETVHTAKNDNSLFENLPRSQQEDLKIDAKIETESYSDVSDEENSTELSDELEQAVEEEEDNEASAYEDYIQDESKSELKNTYKYLLNTLNDSNRTMIDQVKLFVHEMRRITLLREELWYGTLNQIYSDLNKRVEQLNSEITKTNSNPHLSDEEKPKILKQKYQILLQPIVMILEHVQEITTNLPPETPNEETFQLEFEDKIKEVINQLKDSENFNKPSNSLTLFKQLHNTFHHRSQRRQSTSLQMDQISPKLCQLKSTSIPIPGKDGSSIFIYSIANAVQVLPTKTKPKKLFFVGSNGRRYPYLFKGLEDLHLDERIMQLLNIINSMFSKLNKTETVQFHALNYSVTPLGPRSGLISWVEGATPLFNLYKKWQQREAVYLASKAQNPSQHVHLMRPNDIFYAKLNPLLKEKGIKNFQENRSECPVPVLRKVLEDLIKETPSDLLSKEIWCNSTTPANWWTSVQIFCRSTAVMSMIGYVIGLGDRHLDNVLINLRTGQVVHIDYNICFEKGHNLRVPEKVPFRMTQNVQQALGLTGCEGLFKLSSEQVLNILRHKRETLLTLLEAFVYDPLLDWTGHDTGIIASFYGGGSSKLKSENGENKKETRKNLEKKQTWELFEIRLLENKALMHQNRLQLENFVCQNLDTIKTLSELSKRKGLNDNLIRLNEQAKIYLDESLTLHETMKNKTAHPVYTLRDRYALYESFNQNLNSVKCCMDTELAKLENLIQQQLTALEFFKSKKIEFEPVGFTRAHELVKEFLKSSGQSALVELSDKIFDEISKQEDKLKSSMLTLSNLKQTMEKFLEFFCADFLVAQGKHCKFVEWLKELRDSLTQDVFDRVKKEFEMEFVENFDCQIVNQKLGELKSSLGPVESRLQSLEERKSKLLDSNQAGYQEIHLFISDNLNEFTGDQLFESFNSCLLQFFGENLQKWMAMETAAIDAKENLIGVRSMDGDWYLEEMLTLVQNCAHLANVVSSVFTKFNKFTHDDLSEVNFKKSLDIFAPMESLFQILNNLVIDFDSVLLEKLLKMCFSSGQDLDALMGEFKSMELDEFFEIISIQTSSDVMNGEYSQKINDIKSKYGKLLTVRNAKLSSQILLEFEQMFSKVDIEFDKAIKFCKNFYSIQDPNAQNQNLFMYTPNLVFLMDPSNLIFMKNLFLVKKIHAIYSCIKNCAQFKQYCFGSKIDYNFTQEDLVYPLKQYVSEFIVQMLNGIPVILIGNMVNILGNDQYNLINLDPSNQAEQISFLINQKLMINQINNYYFNTFNQLMLNLDASWVNDDLLKRVNSNIRYNKTFLKLVEDLIVSMEWLYDPFIVDSFSNQLSVKTWREALMENLEIISDDLGKKLEFIKKNLAEINQNDANILKRLEWSSNSNPSLVELGKKFKEMSRLNEENFAKQFDDLERLINCINMWINFEQIRGPKSKLLIEIEKNFANLLKLIEEKEILDSSKVPNMSEAELNLINFKSFKDQKPLNSSILQEYYRLLYDEVALMKRVKQKEEKDFTSKIDELNKGLFEFKSILNQHNKIMTDIKPILKSMTKFAENQRLSDYSKTYQKFSEICQHLIRILANKELIEAETSDLEEKCQQLCQIVPTVYADLNTLNEPYEKKIDNNKNDRKNGDKVLRANQEGNSHAIAVWKRVYEKLDGRDPDANNQITVQEQVNYLIEEATDLNNLAVLYEGWTPWV